MIRKFEIEVSANAFYEIEARSQEEAIELAYNWFLELNPDFEIHEVDSFKE